MLTRYIQAALAHAVYESLDEEGWYARVPDLDTVWASGPTIEACRAELQRVVEDWLVLRLRDHRPIPTLDGITLIPAGVA